MSQRASARVARFLHYRGSATGTILVARIAQGPQSELGRMVHIPVTKADLPALRQVIERLEKSDG
jgi:hypothetical protein